ncbi:aromatic acid/H+ symport family MFS transporter [Streptomyces montanus]|uniref:Aromatic acid/H+ symport family MFS transporter n=1 Tax=Streptomyces montanus TaxID=2580423 RepID=A0A5R9G0U0_9ACTN|nr:MFS transporter [Streptomyces montanus]TLS46593.1 aromatic acid/H+ symport family MFS transporter [Streptomyces montanus]
MAVTTAPVRAAGRTLTAGHVMLLAWVVASLEGFDLSVYGVVVPSLLRNPSLGIDKVQAGTIGSFVGIGMLVGAALAGAVTHRTGPRRLVMAGTVCFSGGMLISAVAPGAGVFGLGRLVVGLGLGVVLPTLNSYVADLSRPEHRSRNICLMMSGYAGGALLAPVLGTLLLPQVSFRWLFVLGVVPVFAVAPFLMRIPESPFHLLRTGRAEESQAVTTAFGLPAATVTVENPGKWLGLGSLLTRRLAVTTVLFWAMSFCGLLLVFGISAWLPTIMQAAGYSLGSALMQTAAMWLGVGFGVILGGRVADAVGPRRVVIVAFLSGTVGLALMSLDPGQWLLYPLLFISGFGFIGSQILGNALVATTYPDAVRGNGLAWALSIGRFGAIVGPTMGALVLTSGLPVQWAFYSFAVPGVIGAAAVAAVPRRRKAL